jgi:putative transposase
MGPLYLHAYETVSATKSGIDRYLEFYNGRRPHRTLDGDTPNAFYFANLPVLEQAA